MSYQCHINGAVTIIYALFFRRSETFIFLFQMATRLHLCRTAKQVAERAIANGQMIRDIVVIPPNDGLSEDDDIDDENVGEVIVNGELPGEYEVVEILEEDEQINEDHVKVSLPRWGRKKAKYTKLS